MIQDTSEVRMSSGFITPSIMKLVEQAISDGRISASRFFLDIFLNYKIFFMVEAIVMKITLYLC